MAILTINTTAMPEPTVFKLPQFDLDSDGTFRNELGVLQRDRVRQGIYKIELEYKGISSADLNIINTAINPIKFNATFMSPTGMITKSMYAGDRNTEMVKYNSDFNKIRWDISFNLVEF